MTPYEIPLSPEPQKFTVQLGGVSRKMRVFWNRDADCWCFDLRAQDDAPLVLGAPVVTGCDLLGAYAHLALGGSMVAQTDHDPAAPPTFENLGLAGRVYFVVTDDGSST